MNDFIELKARGRSCRRQKGKAVWDTLQGHYCKYSTSLQILLRQLAITRIDVQKSVLFAPVVSEKDDRPFQRYAAYV